MTGFRKVINLLVLLVAKGRAMRRHRSLRLSGHLTTAWFVLAIVVAHPCCEVFAAANRGHEGIGSMGEHDHSAPVGPNDLCSQWIDHAPDAVVPDLLASAVQVGPPLILGWRFSFHSIDAPGWFPRPALHGPPRTLYLILLHLLY